MCRTANTRIERRAMSFFGNVLKAFGGLFAGKPNAGLAAGQPGARPAATPPVQDGPPPGGSVNAGRRVDKRTMAMDPLPQGWTPGMPQPPGWGARPDEYPHDAGGSADHGPTTRYVGLPEGMS